MDEKLFVKTNRMDAGVRLSSELLKWVRLSIADAVVLFGRLEQKYIEIAWLMRGADLKERVKIARNPAGENFSEVISIIEEAAGTQFDAVRQSFVALAYDRNLMVHGSWVMAEGRPYVVWHKFLEDYESVIGEFFDKARFEAFMKKANVLFDTGCKFHDELEAALRSKTDA